MSLINHSGKMKNNNRICVYKKERREKVKIAFINIAQVVYNIISLYIYKKEPQTCVCPPSLFSFSLISNKYKSILNITHE
jgi:hypothetical protein